MSNNIGKWGWIRNEEYISDPIVKSFVSENIGATMYCTDENDGILTMQLCNDFIKVPFQSVEWRKDSPFTWNEKVQIKSKGIFAEIEYVCWHYEEEKIFYHLTIAGKKTNKRFDIDDLEKIDFQTINLEGCLGFINDSSEQYIVTKDCGDTLSLKSANGNNNPIEFEISRSCFNAIGKPKFKIGDVVRDLQGKTEGTTCDISFFFPKARFRYLINTDNGIEKKHFFERDLIKVG